MTGSRRSSSQRHPGDGCPRFPACRALRVGYRPSFESDALGIVPPVPLATTTNSAEPIRVMRLLRQHDSRPAVLIHVDAHFVARSLRQRVGRLFPPIPPNLSAPLRCIAGFSQASLEDRTCLLHDNGISANRTRSFQFLAKPRGLI
jgi:hypothetical protein